MQKLHFSIIINAPKEKVWKNMLEDAFYRQWTEPFSVGSHYVGVWNTGSKILFLAPGEKGMSGMVSRIKENRPYEYLSIQHLGVVENGKEDTTSEAVKKWTPAFENYTFKEKYGKTELLVEMDSAEEYADMFNSMWPKGLERLKEIAEK